VHLIRATRLRTAHGGLSNAFDDAEVPLRRRSQDLQGCLVSSTVVGGERVLKTFEFHHNDPLLQTRLSGFDSIGGANQRLTATGLYSWNREIAIFFERIGVSKRLSPPRCDRVPHACEALLGTRRRVSSIWASSRAAIRRTLGCDRRRHLLWKVATPLPTPSRQALLRDPHLRVRWSTVVGQHDLARLLGRCYGDL